MSSSWAESWGLAAGKTSTAGFSMETHTSRSPRVSSEELLDAHLDRDPEVGGDARLAQIEIDQSDFSPPADGGEGERQTARDGRLALAAKRSGDGDAPQRATLRARHAS